MRLARTCLHRTIAPLHKFRMGSVLVFTLLMTTAQTPPPPDSFGAFAFASNRNGERSIYVDFGTGEVRNLTPSPEGSSPLKEEWESFPALSHNQLWVAFSADRGGNRDIYIVSASGGVPKQLMTGIGAEIAPAWSPDDRYLAYLSDELGTWAIHILDLVTGDENSVTEDEASYLSPSWSADGRQIAYFVQWPDQWAIQTMEIQSGQATTIFSGTGDGYAWSEWSPDGTQIAIAVRASTRSNEFYVMDPDGSNQTLLTDSEYMLYKLTWSDDSQWILFDSFRGGNLDIYALRRDGSEVVRVTTDVEDDLHPG